MANSLGRAPSGQALVASDEAGSRLHPAGFDPSRDDVKFALVKLTEEQRTFLLHGRATTEWQTATPDEWDGPLYCRLHIEKDYFSPLWLGSKDAHYKGDGGPWHLSYRYTDFGLAVRAAIAMEARQGGDAPCPGCGGIGDFHNHPCPDLKARLHAEHDSAAIAQNTPGMKWEDSK